MIAPPNEGRIMVVQLHDEKEMELHEDCCPDGNPSVVSSSARFVWKLHQIRLNCSDEKLTRESARASGSPMNSLHETDSLDGD
jgi:hypothetical protein